MSQPGPSAMPAVALVGSGEFLPVMAPIDIALLAGRTRRVAVVPTASARDGADRVQYWIDLGTAHYRDLDAEAVAVPALTRDDANDAELAGRIDGCGLIYLSGGNPGYLAATLSGTLLWSAITDAIAEGAAIAGCSAGAMALTELSPDVDDRTHMGPGLRHVPGLCVIPHFDRIRDWVPGIVDRYLEACPPGCLVIGIDEDTAIVDGLGPGRWTVMGRQGVHVLRADGDTAVLRAGDELQVTLP